MIAARIGNAGGVVIGLGDGEMFIASDMPAILEHTRKVVFLESRQMAVVTARGIRACKTLDGEAGNTQVHHGSLGSDRGGKGRVPALYAERDPRAGALADRYARRAGRF